MYTHTHTHTHYLRQCRPSHAPARLVSYGSYLAARVRHPIEDVHSADKRTYSTARHTYYYMGYR